MNIEVIETKPNFFTAIVSGEFADMLTKDEALGVVASALFAKRPIFVKSYEAWLVCHKKYREYEEPIALLACP